MSAYFQVGYGRESLAHARRLRETTSSEQLSLIADGTDLMVEAQFEGHFGQLDQHLETMANRQRGTHPHFYGVTMLNRALVAITADQPTVALTWADEAIFALEETSSRVELAAATMAKGYSLTMLGRVDEGQIAIEAAARAEPLEASYERADVADSFVNPEIAGPFLEALHDGHGSDVLAQSLALVQLAWLHGRRGRVVEARTCLDELGALVPTSYMGRKTFERLTGAYIALCRIGPRECGRYRRGPTREEAGGRPMGTCRGTPGRREWQP